MKFPGPTRQSRPGGTSGISNHVRYASNRYRNGEALKPTRRVMDPLRQRMIEDMNARKLCAGTQKGASATR